MSLVTNKQHREPTTLNLLCTVQFSHTFFLRSRPKARWHQIRGRVYTMVNPKFWPEIGWRFQKACWTPPHNFPRSTSPGNAPVLMDSQRNSHEKGTPKSYQDSVLLTWLSFFVFISKLRGTFFPLIFFVGSWLFIIKQGTVEPRFNGVAGDRPNLFVKWRVCYIEKTRHNEFEGKQPKCSL